MRRTHANEALLRSILHAVGLGASVSVVSLSGCESAGGGAGGDGGGRSEGGRYPYATAATRCGGVGGSSSSGPPFTTGAGGGDCDDAGTDGGDMTPDGGGCAGYVDPASVGVDASSAFSNRCSNMFYLPV